MPVPKDSAGTTFDGKMDNSESDRYCERFVEDFMRKGFKGGVRTRDFHPVCGPAGRDGGKVGGGRSAAVTVPCTIKDGKVIREE